VPSENDRLRALPSVDVLASDEALAAWPPAVRTQAARRAIAEARERLRAGEEVDVATLAVQQAMEMTAFRHRTVINLSGIVLHTGLGRARLHPSVAAAMQEVAAGHADLEFDLAEGVRGDRMAWVTSLLTEMTGAEDALVVNNCAGALMLCLAALGRPVVLSRGQMVEIGGSFRMPDVVRAAGVPLIEVGCTNKTHLADYGLAMAASSAPGVVLRCHRSNFQMTGFVAEPSARELSALARENGWLVVDDLGSGCLLATERFGLPHERTLTEALKDGTDVVLASGDKLLGGPQAGLVLGRREVVRQVRRHPIARAVRADKTTLAGLAATLQLYQQGREGEIPVWEAVGRALEVVASQAKRLAEAYPGEAVVAEGVTELGGGSLPGAGVATWRAGLRAASADPLAKSLRTGSPAIVGRIEDGTVWLDPRTATEEELLAAGARLAAL